MSGVSGPCRLRIGVGDWKRVGVGMASGSTPGTGATRSRGVDPTLSAVVEAASRAHGPK